MRNGPEMLGNAAQRRYALIFLDTRLVPNIVIFKLRVTSHRYFHGTVLDCKTVNIIEHIGFRSFPSWVCAAPLVAIILAPLIKMNDHASVISVSPASCC